MNRILSAAFFALVSACASAGPRAPADLIVSNAKIYTADARRSFVEAMAVRGDEIIFAGDGSGAAAFAGRDTRLIDAGGKLVLPGLHDAHLHPVGAMEVDTCAIDKKAMTLAELSEFVAACVARFKPASGEWLFVELWEFERGNEPAGGFATIRSALDAAAPDNPVLLEGTDGHHFAVNSRALATARNAEGAAVGLSAKTLATDFADLAQYVGVDASGEPNGKLTETYIYDRLDTAAMQQAEMAKRIAHPERMMEVTLSRGITSFLDAAARPDTLPIYDALLGRGEFFGRATLALYFDPGKYVDAKGVVDFNSLLKEAEGFRRKYANSGLVKADFLKLFADGVLEGDPLSAPPTLPNAAVSRPYLQPIFDRDDYGNELRVAGYVDLQSADCKAARAAAESGVGPDAKNFSSVHGFHPDQCSISSGVLQHPRKTILDYVAAGDKAGFTFNIHAIGDESVRTALDAIEVAQAQNRSGLRHVVTHLQLVRPEDVARISALGAFASFTFAWATIDPEYDLTVIPFIDRIDGAGGIYDPASYYMSNAYPAESIRKAGGVLIAGSDAPVDTRDPRPFVNIEAAVTRDIFDAGALNSEEAVSIFDAVDAYTINAAKALRQDEIAGSIERGKKADFVIVDQDVFALAGFGQAAAISETLVLETWFGGKSVFKRE